MNQIFNNRLSYDIDAGTIALEHTKLLPKSLWQRIAIFALRRAMMAMERRIPS